MGNKKMNELRTIAYFSMEIGLEAEMATYSGGLGVLAGDTIRAAADLQVPMIAVTLLYRKGYFRQRLDSSGWQHEQSEEWEVEKFLQELPARAVVRIEGRAVHLRAWRYEVAGNLGYKVPVYFLDANLPENSEWDRALTDVLYGGDQHYRLCQEVILGIGGVRMLRTLGYDQLRRFHMNEGHASLLTLALLEEEAQKTGRAAFNQDDIEAVRQKCIFTTHTPVPAGHDQFHMDLVQRVLGPREDFINLKDVFAMNLVGRVLGRHEAFSDMKEIYRGENVLNMTYLGLNLSHYVNGVAKKHGEVSRLMFGDYRIDAITNGVHASSWVAEPFQQLYDRYIWGWEQDNFSLRYALSIPKPEVWQAHQQTKHRLLQYVRDKTGVELNAEVLTLGFARRAATYKRADLLFTDLERLKHLSNHAGAVQLIYAGKAHPQDQNGKAIIQRIMQAQAALRPHLNMLYLENYDLQLGKLLTSGVDVWLNTPQPPLEASGTSGMKAALNGVPSLSTLDGWWIEGCIEGVTGWAIGAPPLAARESLDSSKDAASLYEQLERAVIPLYYRDRERFIEIMRHAIALNGSFFNTHRMLQQYVLKAYFG